MKPVRVAKSSAWRTRSPWFSSSVIGWGQDQPSKPGVERIWSMLELHAAWSEALCSGPSGCSRKASWTRLRGGSNEAGTNSVMGPHTSPGEQQDEPSRTTGCRGLTAYPSRLTPTPIGVAHRSGRTCQSQRLRYRQGGGSARGPRKMRIVQISPMTAVAAASTESTTLLGSPNSLGLPPPKVIGSEERDQPANATPIVAMIATASRNSRRPVAGRLVRLHAAIECPTQR